MNYVFEYGSEEDYEFGWNDFPVTPSHVPANFGLAFAYFMTDHIGIDLDGRYYLRSKVTLIDPFDGDRVEIKTSSHYSLILNFIFQFTTTSYRPYLVVGLGMDKLLAKDETYISEYGYEIEFLAPEKTVDFATHLGIGTYIFISQNLGIKLDVRYIYIPGEANSVSSVNATTGLFFRFF